MINLRELIQQVLEGKTDRADLERALYERLVSSSLVLHQKNEKSAEASAHLVSQLIDGDLRSLYDGIGGFDGWFERAGLLRLIGREPLNDDEFAIAVLDQENGVTEVFVEQYTKPLAAYLRSKCDEEDERSKDRATEIATEVINDCGSGLIQKYNAKGSLEGWLRRVAYNRLKDWWKKEGREELSDTVGDEGDDELWAGPKENEEVLIEAVRHGFRWLKLFYPLELVIIRLTSLYEIPARTVSRIYGINEGDISRMKRAGMASLRTEITRSIEMQGHEYSWEQIASFIARHQFLAKDEDEVAGISEG